MKKDIRMNIKIWNSDDGTNYASKKERIILEIENKPLMEALKELQGISKKLR